MAKDPLKVLIVASEAVPFAKVGGLADVVGALAKELKNNNLDIRVILPKYLIVKDYLKKNSIKTLNSKNISVKIESKEMKGCVVEVTHDEIPYYFIDNPHYFNREGIYIDNKTRNDYSDSLERFTFFCRGVLEACKAYDFKPDIIHSNDWQTGLISVYLKTMYKLDPFFKNTRTFFLIHNLSYQGIFPVEQFSITGLDWKYFTVNELEYYGHLNLLKGGVVFSDLIVTVSETYSKEIQTTEFGNGLEGIIKGKASQNRLYGIVNGVDYGEWDPETDIHLKEEYNLNYSMDSLQNKKKIKELFLKDQGIKNPDPNIPLIGIISRLVDQKGFDLIFEIMDELLRSEVYFAVLGTGKAEYENKFKEIKSKYPNKTVVILKFDIPLSHFIEAASDVFILPSRFEPCGLNQLYSLKYGTIPVARNTGGLADTIKDGKTGFLFNSYSPDEFLGCLRTAMDMYRNDPEGWQKIQINGMKEVWSWDKAAKKYIELYQDITSNKIMGES